MALWKDFTGIVRNVLGVRATSNLFFGSINNNKSLAPLKFTNDLDGAYVTTTDLENGTLRTILDGDHSISSATISGAAKWREVSVGHGAFATRSLTLEDSFADTKVSEWTVPTRLDLRMRVPIVHGVVYDLDTLADKLWVGKVYMYAGANNLFRPLVNDMLRSSASWVKQTLKPGELFLCLETMEAGADALGEEKIIVLPSSITTAFITHSTLVGNTIVDVENGNFEKIVNNPNAIGDAAYTLLPDRTYGNNADTTQFGIDRTDMQWTLKTPLVTSGEISSVCSGVIKINMSGAVGRSDIFTIPEGCCITGIAVKVGTSASIAPWSLGICPATASSSTATLINYTSINTAANQESQLDDMFEHSIMAAAGGTKLFIETSSRTTVGSLTVLIDVWCYVKYEPLHS
jgi:hypothetical protein